MRETTLISADIAMVEKIIEEVNSCVTSKRFRNIDIISGLLVYMIELSIACGIEKPEILRQVSNQYEFIDKYENEDWGNPITP